MPRTGPTSPATQSVMRPSLIAIVACLGRAGIQRRQIDFAVGSVFDDHVGLPPKQVANRLGGWNSMYIQPVHGNPVVFARAGEHLENEAVRSSRSRKSSNGWPSHVPRTGPAPALGLAPDFRRAFQIAVAQSDRGLQWSCNSGGESGRGTPARGPRCRTAARACSARSNWRNSDTPMASGSSWAMPRAACRPARGRRRSRAARKKEPCATASRGFGPHGVAGRGNGFVQFSRACSSSLACMAVASKWLA